MPYVFAALSAVFAGGYATVKESGVLASRLFFKCAASVMFVMVAYSAGVGTSKAYYVLILIGLCLSLAGDVLLIFTQPRFLVTGAVCFLLAHIVFISAFWTVASPTAYDAAIFAVLVTAGAAAFRKRLRQPSRQIVGGVIYALVLCAMTAKALSMLFVSHDEYIFIVFAAAGAVLFAISEMALACGWFNPGIKQRAGIFSTIAYYSGQILIALSVMM